MFRIRHMLFKTKLLQPFSGSRNNINLHNDVIKWKYFTRYWPFVRGIHRSPVDSPHKGQLRGAFMFSLICAWRTIETLVILDAIGIIMTSLWCKEIYCETPQASVKVATMDWNGGLAEAWHHQTTIRFYLWSKQVSLHLLEYHVKMLLHWNWKMFWTQLLITVES